MPELVPVKSSQIHAIGYEPETRELHVQFHRHGYDDAGGKTKTPGHTYAYSDVPPEAHTALMEAESKGKHFGEHIKGKLFKYRKLEPVKP